MAADRNTFALLRYLIAQGKADKQIRSELGLTVTALAKAAGTSPRSLRRYLSGERKPPESVALRMSVLSEDLRVEARAFFQEESLGDQVPFREVGGVPLRSQRYQRPQSLTGSQQESGIILFDTDGLANSEIVPVLKSLFEYCRKAGGSWDVRFMIEVDVQQYFGDDGPANDDMAVSICDRKTMYLWVPPEPITFVRPRGVSAVRGGADGVIETINARMKQRYLTVVDKVTQRFESRIPADFAFKRIALIPYRDRSNKNVNRRARKANKQKRK